MAGGTQSVAAAAADEAAHCGEEQSEEEVTTARDAGGVNFIKRNIEVCITSQHSMEWMHTCLHARTHTYLVHIFNHKLMRMCAHI